MSATSNRYRGSIDADATVPIIRITRDFDATPAQLMRAHTDPELFARWVVQTFTFDGQPEDVALEEGYAKLDALVAELR